MSVSFIFCHWSVSGSGWVEVYVTVSECTESLIATISCNGVVWLVETYLEAEGARIAGCWF